MKTYEKPQMNFVTVEQDVVTLSGPWVEQRPRGNGGFIEGAPSTSAFEE